MLAQGQHPSRSPLREGGCFNWTADGTTPGALRIPCWDSLPEGLMCVSETLQCCGQLLRTPIPGCSLRKVFTSNCVYFCCSPGWICLFALARHSLVFIWGWMGISTASESPGLSSSLFVPFSSCPLSDVLISGSANCSQIRWMWVTT